MQKYFTDKGAYYIFLEDTKENVVNSKTLETINTIIKKDIYTKDGVNLDLSRTTITEISDRFFEGNKNLKKVILPDTLTIIGQYAFYDCSSLTEINFPSSIADIKDAAFQSCISLKTADLSQTKIVTASDKLFDNCSSLIEVILPETVTLIKKSFSSCSALKEVNLLSK